MAYDFVFGNALRFELQADAADNTVTLSVSDTVASDVANALQSGSRYPLVLADQAVIGPGISYEIVYVTAADEANDALTVERAREGTSAQAWPSGTVCQNALTAGVMNTLRTDRRATDLFQIECLEANALIDGTTLEDQVEVVVPPGYRFWPWILHEIITDIDLGSASEATYVLSVGTSSLGKDIYDLPDSFVPESVQSVGQNIYNYVDDSKTGFNDTFYVWVKKSDQNVNNLKARVVIEGMLAPKNKTGFTA